jgi:hypothetical protein
MTRKTAALAILLLATACVPSMVATPPQEPIQIGFYSVTPQTEWNRPMMTRSEVWTGDGFALQSLRFLDVADGETLSGREDPEGKAPVFRKTMLYTEIQEFIVETLATAGWANVKPKGLKPAKFGGLPGFRFSFDMLSEDGLEYDGVVLGTVREDTLHIIAYVGTRLHYYPKYAKDVEKLFASIRT